MQFCVLGSGSRGNATYVAAGGGALLIDNGFSGVELERRLTAVGSAVASLGAILLTHAHQDHIKGVAVLARKHRLPIYANRGTIAAAGNSLHRVPVLHEFVTGASFALPPFRIHPFAVCHDCADPVGFVIEQGPCTLGYCTDTGMISRLIRHRLAGCNGLIIECNHDPQMLKNGPYPVSLQQRIRSSQGHLANEEAARFIAQLLHDGLQHVVLAHLSEKNNDPQLAFETVVAAVRAGHDATAACVSLAWQDKAGEMITLTGCSGDDVP